MKLFKPEDFETDVSLLKQGHGDIPYISTPLASNIANEKLKEWLDAAPTVYGYIGSEGSTWSSYKPGTFIQENNTHSAKLLCIEEIKKECKHEPDLINQKIGGWFCKHCNAELVAEWKVK